MGPRARFTVEFDSSAWLSMNDEQRAAWIDRVTEAINSEAYVSKVETN